MKKYLLFSITVIMMAAGCNKAAFGPVEVNVEKEELAELDIALEGFLSDIRTKADYTGADNDNLIHNIQVFIFRKGGAQEGLVDAACYYSYPVPQSGNLSMDPIRCTVGERQCMVIVNAPLDYTASISTLAELQAKTFTLADCVDGDTRKLVMVGTRMEDAGGREVTRLEPGEQRVTVRVLRLESAIELTKVVNRMQIPSLQGKVKLTGAYLMNVPGLQNYAGTLKASVPSAIPDANWYARNRKAAAGEPQSLLKKTAASAMNVPYGDTGIAPGFKMYSLPSDIGGAYGTDTRVEGDGNIIRTSTYLIVEAKVDGTACVYPILLPQLEANKKYNVTLTINHIGGDPDKPWEKIRFAGFSASVSIVDWTDVDYSETI